MQKNKLHFQSDINLPLGFIKPSTENINDDYPVMRAGMNYNRVLKKLESSRGIKVEGSYSTALVFYSWLKRIINTKYPVYDYLSSRKTKAVLNEKAGKILIKITDHRPDLEKAPEIPWLKTFYPDKRNFLISLPDLLGMNGAWQWYVKGIRYPMLNKSLHPFYGVYFPTRMEHLIMFDEWLSKNKRNFNFALDIGTGCGILSLIIARHGIAEIHATDINPNAVYSASQELIRHPSNSKIKIEKASFFGSLNKVGGLVVFNPPWIPGVCMNITDRGTYYENGFFNSFFKDADKMMAPGSTLCIIFSSFAIEAGITAFNPIEKETFLNNNFLLEEKITKKITERTSRRSKSWLNNIRNKEKTELWIFKKQGS